MTPTCEHCGNPKKTHLPEHDGATGYFYCDCGQTSNPMTNQQDILGFLKELQRDYEYAQTMGQGKDRFIASTIGVNFPLIAEAFLALDGNMKSMEQTNAALLKKLAIAVEALEKLIDDDRCPSGECSIADVQYRDCFCSPKVAKEALSKIRSLPLS